MSTENLSTHFRRGTKSEFVREAFSEWLLEERNQQWNPTGNPATWTMEDAAQAMGRDPRDLAAGILAEARRRQLIDAVLEAVDALCREPIADVVQADLAVTQNTSLADTLRGTAAVLCRIADAADALPTPGLVTLDPTTEGTD